MKPRWQYKVLVLDERTETSEVRLNTSGSAGWELVGIGGRYSGEQFAYLKRRVEKDDAA